MRVLHPPKPSMRASDVVLSDAAAIAPEVPARDAEGRRRQIRINTMISREIMP